MTSTVPSMAQSHCENPSKDSSTTLPYCEISPVMDLKEARVLITAEHVIKNLQRACQEIGALKFPSLPPAMKERANKNARMIAMASSRLASFDKEKPYGHTSKQFSDKLPLCRKTVKTGPINIMLNPIKRVPVTYSRRSSEVDYQTKLILEKFKPRMINNLKTPMVRSEGKQLQLVRSFSPTSPLIASGKRSLVKKRKRKAKGVFASQVVTNEVCTLYGISPSVFHPLKDEKKSGKKKDIDNVRYRLEKIKAEHKRLISSVTYHHNNS